MPLKKLVVIGQHLSFIYECWFQFQLRKKFNWNFFVPLKVSGVLGVVVRSLLGKDGHNFETEFVFKNKIILSRSQICSIVPAIIWFYNLKRVHSYRTSYEYTFFNHNWLCHLEIVGSNPAWWWVYLLSFYPFSNVSFKKSRLIDISYFKNLYLAVRLGVQQA